MILVALTCVIDVGQGLYRGRPVDWIRVFLAVGFVALAAHRVYRARARS